MTLPPLEPRSSTLDTIDAAPWHVQHARRAVMDEVAYLGHELDRLRAEYAKMKVERDAALAELASVLARAGIEPLPHAHDARPP